MGTGGGTVADGHGRRVKITPSHRLYGFGAILLVSLTICSRKLGSVGEPSFIIPLAIAGVAYLLAIRELFSTPKFPRRVHLHRAPVGGAVANSISIEGAGFR